MKKIKAFLAKRKKIRSVLWLTAVCLFVIWVIFGHKYRFTYNEGESMQPTYSNGEWIIVEKRDKLPELWKPDRFDVVVVLEESSGDKLCKRVIGLAGEEVEVIEGVVYVNGKIIKEPFSQGSVVLYLVDEKDNNLIYWEGPEKGEPVTELVNEKQGKIPEGYVWVIGDNRELSWYGQVKTKNIIGLVVL